MFIEVFLPQLLLYVCIPSKYRIGEGKVKDLPRFPFCIQSVSFGGGALNQAQTPVLCFLFLA